MIRTLIGGLVGGVVMFIVGFVFWASPLAKIGLSSAGEQQSANVQLALANNLPHGGVYIVPDPDTSGGTVLYGKGPVAMVNYNIGGYSTSDPSVMIGGFIQEVAISVMIAFTLFVVAGRVTDFESRGRLVVGFAAAATVLGTLSDPIWMHGDWKYGIYALIADGLMLIVPGLVIARWFLPGPSAAAVR